MAESKLGEPRRRRWLRLAAGLLLFGALFLFLAALPSIPGSAGEVLRHNLESDIQATALIYQDLDRMPELTERAERLRRLAAERRAADAAPRGE